MLIHKRIRSLKKTVKNASKQKVYEKNEEGQAIINVGAENYDDIFSSSARFLGFEDSSI